METIDEKVVFVGLAPSCAAIANVMPMLLKISTNKAITNNLDFPSCLDVIVRSPDINTSLVFLFDIIILVI